MDWQKIINHLRSRGWTLTRIAHESGTSVSTISEIAQGRTREPRGELAVRLYQMAQDHGYTEGPARNAA